MQMARCYTCSQLFFSYNSASNGLLECVSAACHIQRRHTQGGPILCMSCSSTYGESLHPALHASSQGLSSPSQMHCGNISFLCVSRRYHCATALVCTCFSAALHSKWDTCCCSKRQHWRRLLLKARSGSACFLTSINRSPFLLLLAAIASLSCRYWRFIVGTW